MAMAKAEQVLTEGVAQYLEPGERVLSALVAAPRGHTQAVAGVSGLGESQTAKQASAGESAGFVIESPMGVVLTDRRLLGLRVSAPVGGGIGLKVKELIGAVPVSDIDSIEAKRLLVGSRLILTIRGVPIKLEAGAGAATKPLAEAFRTLRGG
jgi:hypothetical protein